MTFQSSAHTISIGFENPNNRELFQLYSCASFFKLLFQFFSFILGSAFLDGSRSTFDHVLGFFQAKTGDRANGFDNADFLVAEAGQDYVELVLFSGSFGTSVTIAGSQVQQLQQQQPKRRISLPLRRLNRRLP